MKRNILVAVIIAGLLAGACAMYKATLQTQTAGVVDPSVTYKVIKYGANYGDDYSTVAFIVPEHGKYRFEIFRPDFQYRVLNNVPAKKALEIAQEFVKANPDFARSEINAVIGSNGEVVGYEVRPLYRTLLFGKEDILLIGYFLKEGNVIEVHIDVDDVVKDRDKGGPGSSDDGN